MSENPNQAQERREGKETSWNIVDDPVGWTFICVNYQPYRGLPGIRAQVQGTRPQAERLYHRVVSTCIAKPVAGGA